MSPCPGGHHSRLGSAGQLTGVRFYKASTNIGVHTGSLWSSTGTRRPTGMGELPVFMLAAVTSGRLTREEREQQAQRSATQALSWTLRVSAAAGSSSS